MSEIQALVEQTAQALTRQRLMLATAESCTGGLIAAMLTSIPGSSAWFERGWVTYSNESKQQQLGVEASIIRNAGAVSEEMALAMAKGAIVHSSAHVSVAVTGIAGPDGGTQEKPVGTVWIGWGQKLGYAEARLFHFSGDRQSVREQAAEMALQGLLARLRD